MEGLKLSDWKYEDLEDDIAELQRNLMNMNQQQILKTEKIQTNRKNEKAEKRLRKTIKNIFNR